MFLYEALGLYKERHGQNPTRIVVTPAAALTLAFGQELPRFVDGVPVITREFSIEDVAKKGPELGVFIKRSDLGADRKPDAYCLRSVDLFPVLSV